MKAANRIRTFLVLGLLATLVTGCGSLSLFSDRHVHYHGSEQTDKRVDTLNQRIDALEKRVEAMDKAGNAK